MNSNCYNYSDENANANESQSTAIARKIMLYSVQKCYFEILMQEHLIICEKETKGRK
jgi:hypothetical protein